LGAFAFLGLFEFALLLEELALLELAGQLVDVLAQLNLLGVPLVAQRLLMLQQLLLELPLSDRLDA